MVWATWNDSSTSYSYTSSNYYTGSSNNLWYTWSATSSATTITNNYAAPPRVSAAERRASEEKRIAKRKRERHFKRMAELRAERLLLEHLSPAQRAEYRADGEFTVLASGGRRYLIRKGRQHNVFELDDEGVRVKELCGHVSERVPDADNILAQKLWLETAEDEFVAKCNIWDLTGYRRLSQEVAA